MSDDQTHHSEMTTTLEKAIPKVNACIEHLKGCKDFSTKEVYENLSEIRHYLWGGLSHCEDPGALGKHVAESDFGLLFPKMWTLTECLGHIPAECQFETFQIVDLFIPHQLECQGLINLKELLGIVQCFADASPEFAASLGKCGAIKLLFDELKKLKSMHIQFADKNSTLFKFVFCILAVLYNLIRHCSSNLKFYRNSDAVPILKGFLKQDEDGDENKDEGEEAKSWLQLRLLLVLAYVVKDEESEILASEEFGVRVLTDCLCKAVQSSDYKMDPRLQFSAHDLLDTINLQAKNDANKKAIATQGETLSNRMELCLPFSAHELLDAINHLARNDANKKAIAATGAIPYIIQMLQNDFTPEDQQVAAEALWNLSFIPEIRKSDALQRAVLSKFCDLFST